jgi:alkylation response protein AidB-like acyl-CoA dehydrogenase/acyl dehydratase/putative sterol carrier protein
MTLTNDDKILYTPDELTFRKQVREFVDREIKPIKNQIEERTFSHRQLFKKLADAGLSGLLVPEAYGGSEQPFVYQLIAGEEISVISPSTTMMFGASCTLSAIPILRFGTEEQKQKYLVPLAKGEKIGALAITEPAVGSDTAGMETQAVWNKKNDCWILNGEKRYISNGGIADQIVVFAITDPTVDSKSGMSAFIIETSWKGFSVERDFTLMGRAGAIVSHIKFDNMKIPKENLLGKINQGFLILMDELDSERIGIAAEALGCMRTPFQIAVDYSQQRIQFNRPISRFEGVSFKIADMALKMRAARLLTLSAGRMVDKGLSYTKEATMAKLFATEAAVEVCDLAIQICGGAGYVKDYFPLEQYYRDARLGTIGGGTSEILRYLIQREVFIEQKREKAQDTVSTDLSSIDFITLMSAVPNGFRADRAEGVSAKIQFLFTDEAPWLLTIKNQKCSIAQKKIKNPMMTVKTDSTTWRRVILGQTDAMQALMAKQVTIDTDNMDLLMKFARMFRFTPQIFEGDHPESKGPKKGKKGQTKFVLGKSLDEIQIGEKAEGSMKVTKDHIEWYAKMSGDYNPLHMDDEYAATTMFGRRIAHGPVGGALVARVIGMQLPGLGTLAYNMKVNFTAPVFPGDEIKAIIEATEKVPEKNLLRLSFTVVNQKGLEVMNGYANVLPPIKD